MPISSASPSFIRRAALAAGVVALGLATFAPTQALANVHPDKKNPTINTYSAWDGSSNITSFGCPNTTTYGQVITIPAGKPSLNKFKFWLTDFGATGSMDVRGEVYAWDGSTATGAALFESPVRTVSYGDVDFHREAFNTGGVAVTPGSQYVVFASIDKDFESCTDPYTTGWASVADDVYPDGTFVYQNNGGDESQWVGGFWSTFGGDLAFKAYLS